jgi:hypothetical protein
MSRHDALYRKTTYLKNSNLSLPECHTDWTVFFFGSALLGGEQYPNNCINNSVLPHAASCLLSGPRYIGIYGSYV